MIREDLKEGTVFGINKNHTVLCKTDIKKDGRPLYKCKCGICGNEEWFLAKKYINKGKNEHCGCENKLEGKTFGKINVHSVISETEKRDITGSKIYICKCSVCNRGDWELSARRIKFDAPISCGCVDNKSIAVTKHGMSKNNKYISDIDRKFYITWGDIKNRHKNKKNKDNKKYIERNIKCCERWKNSFEEFKADMYDSYLKAISQYGLENTSIDRINVYGDYEPNNCRWANASMQSYNRDFTDNSNNNPILCTRLEDDYTIITYNAKQFSRRIFGTHGHHIIEVCKGKRPQEKGWKFSYIDDEMYFNLKDSGVDYIESLYEFKISIPYHDNISEEENFSIHKTRDDYKKSVNFYYINSDNVIAYGSKKEVLGKLGFRTISSFDHFLYKPIPDKVRKLTPEEIELHKNNQPIKF